MVKPCTQQLINNCKHLLKSCGYRIVSTTYGELSVIDPSRMRSALKCLEGAEAMSVMITADNINEPAVVIEYCIGKMDDKNFLHCVPKAGDSFACLLAVADIHDGKLYVAQAALPQTPQMKEVISRFTAYPFDWWYLIEDLYARSLHEQHSEESNCNFEEKN